MVMYRLWDELTDFRVQSVWRPSKIKRLVKSEWKIPPRKFLAHALIVECRARQLVFPNVAFKTCFFGTRQPLPPDNGATRPTGA
jgi:hypothetical protein